MKLKLKEVGSEYVISLGAGVKLRPYLEIAQINDIVAQCLATRNSVEREMIKVCKTVEYCTNIDIGKGKKINGEELYNLVASLRIINDLELEIDNYNIIDFCIQQSENIYNAIREIGDNVKDFDISDMQKTLETLRGVANGTA